MARLTDGLTKAIKDLNCDCSDLTQKFQQAEDEQLETVRKLENFRRKVDAARKVGSFYTCRLKRVVADQNDTQEMLKDIPEEIVQATVTFEKLDALIKREWDKLEDLAYRHKEQIEEMKKQCKCGMLKSEGIVQDTGRQDEEGGEATG